MTTGEGDFWTRELGRRAIPTDRPTFDVWRTESDVKKKERRTHERGLYTPPRDETEKFVTRPQNPRIQSAFV